MRRITQAKMISSNQHGQRIKGKCGCKKDEIKAEDGKLRLNQRRFDFNVNATEMET